MLFFTFKSQSERRDFGGSALIEFQFCKLPAGTDIAEIVSGDGLNFWQNDSLYVCDENAFFIEYSRFFDGGTYNNLQKGIVDIYGINYYSSLFTDRVTKKILNKKPPDYEILLDWLNKSKEYNGFYILGL